MACLWISLMFRIVLVQPDIPQNTGNIGRLCVGLDAELHLVYPLGFILDDKRVKRAGLDYWQHLKLIKHDSWDDFLKTYPDDRKFFLTTKTKQSYTAINFEKNDFLIFGCETKGLPKEILEKHWDQAVTIPMIGKIRSLNLSNAVAVVSYEAMRQITLD
ncbi:tRNA (uridine(34)/cytosine(34)/5-carboxymethylaminomethyluridine(34)-2'-O)-methyltransferase TrmL [bacterium K02(2017)]|nr:tRNA (uridine(34)/cytosine(34)/5-carboxymethylaminomethyluridine(34)-2'-O)-methyltransferase TrmL [bacterium K02(2017)]